jgi:hypothetical protein
MRILAMLATIATVAVIIWEVGVHFYARSHPVLSEAVVSNTMAPHEIHLNYKEMEKLPVHDVKDAN